MPGPGAYESPKTITSNGKYFNSKFNDSKSSAMKSQAERFSGNAKLAPGPGQYNQVSTVNATGRNFLSVFRSSYTRSFGLAERKLGFGNDISKLT